MTGDTAGHRRAVTVLRLLLSGAVVVGAAAGFVVLHRGPPTMLVSAVFSNASQLVPGNSVKLHNVDVGGVTAVHLDGFVADVTLRIDRGLHLPAGTRAKLSTVSLLGEPDVELLPSGTGRLRPGATIPLARTSEASSVESVVGLAGQLTTNVTASTVDSILSNFNRAYGNQPQLIADLITAASGAAAAFDAHSPALVATIAAVQRLSASLAPNTGTFVSAVGQIDNALQQLDSNSASLAGVVSGLGTFSQRASSLLRANQASLDHVGPQLQQVLGEVVGNLSSLLGAINGLPGFDTGWGCAAAGDYLRFVFPLTPQFASLQLGHENQCVPSLGPAGQKTVGKVAVPTPGFTINDPLGTGNVNLGAGSANGGSGSAPNGLAGLLSGTAGAGSHP